MSSYGVTEDGFVSKDVNTIIDELEQEELSRISASLNLLSTSVLGQMNGVFGDKVRELWDVAEAIWGSAYPDSATGTSLDNVAAITGALRLQATKSTLDIICTGDDATALAIGRTVSVADVGDIFESTEAAVIAAASAWAPSTAYAVDDFVQNDDAGTDRIYVCEVAGTSAGSGGPTGTGDAIVDGTVTWRYVGDGEGYVAVAFESSEYGPIAGPAFTLTEIESAVSGWKGAKNLEDADAGRNIETDADFRIRREELLRITGAGTVEAIRSAVRAVDDVLEVFVFENTGLTVDINGLPGKSFEVVVSGGADADIAQTIWETKPAGIETFGSESEIITDSQGFTHTIEFSRPTEIPIYIELTVDVDGGLFPADGADQIKAALKELGDTEGIGDDIISLKYEATPLEIAGVIDVTAFLIDDVFPPVSAANIAIALRELATFDTGDIDLTVNVV